MRRAGSNFPGTGKILSNMDQIKPPESRITAPEHCAGNGAISTSVVSSGALSALVNHQSPLMQSAVVPFPHRHVEGVLCLHTEGRRADDGRVHRGEGLGNVRGHRSRSGIGSTGSSPSELQTIRTRGTPVREKVDRPILFGVCTKRNSDHHVRTIERYHCDGAHPLGRLFS